MSKKIEFFRCFSMNLHNFLKASGIRYMNKGVHSSGIDVSTDGGENWESYPSVYQAKLDGMTADEIDEIRLRLLETRDPISETHGKYDFKKRIRFYWVYETTPDLEKALRIWNRTGPKKQQ